MHNFDYKEENQIIGFLNTIIVPGYWPGNLQVRCYY